MEMFPGIVTHLLCYEMFLIHPSISSIHNLIHLIRAIGRGLLKRPLKKKILLILSLSFSIFYVKKKSLGFYTLFFMLIC